MSANIAAIRGRRVGSSRSTTSQTNAKSTPKYSWMSLSRIPAIWRPGIDSSWVRVSPTRTLDRLTENFDVADHRVLGLAVCKERVVAIFGVVEHRVDRVEGVEEVRALAVHRAMASDRIRSRRGGLMPLR